MDKKEHIAATNMLQRIIGSLIEYPDGGGDIRVMTEVDRIVQKKTNALIQEVERLQGESTQAKLDRDIVTRSLELTLPEVVTSGGREPSRAKLVMLLEYAKTDVAKVRAELEAAREKIESWKRVADTFESSATGYKSLLQESKSEAATLRRVGEEMSDTLVKAMLILDGSLLGSNASTIEEIRAALTAWASTKERK